MPDYTVRRAAGYGLWTDPDGHAREADYLQCVHCGYTWIVQPGSGRKRGFCSQCPGVTCGKRACQAHVSLKKSDEMIEQIHRGLRKQQFFDALGI